MNPERRDRVNGHAVIEPEKRPRRFRMVPTGTAKGPRRRLVVKPPAAAN